MNQNKTISSTKLSGRDFINLGIFTVIFIILFMACIMVMSMTIYTLPFGVALGSFFAASAYMLLRAKAPKTGAIILFGILFGLVMFVMGSGWPILAAVIISSIIAELIVRSGHYKSYTCEVIGYCVLMLGTAIGSYIPFLVMKDYYLKLAEGNSINGEFMSRLVEFISGPYLMLALVTTIVTAILGTMLARAIFKKHLVKAGLIREMK